MDLPDMIAHRILNHAKRANLQGAPPTVTSLCKGYGYPMTSWLRKTVADLLDAEAFPAGVLRVELSRNPCQLELGNLARNSSRCHRFLFMQIKIRFVIRYWPTVTVMIFRSAPTETRKPRVTT